MNINELHSFKLADAIKFHNELNPKLWKNDQLDPLVRKQLLIIAEDFVEELGIPDLDVVDITISGSNAAFTWTKHSDLDLHILVNMSELHQDAVYRELFRAKKTLYNSSHDITVHGIPVELYVQDSAEPVVSLGEYSILHDKWIKIPKRRSANLDQNATKAKFEQLKDLIDVALKTKHSKKISKALQLIRRYRQAGLDKGGEFSPENLAYKAVRSQGAIDALYAMRDKLHSAELTIEEDIRLDEDDMLAEELRKEFEGYSGPRGKSSSPIGQIKTLTARDIKGKYTDDQLIALGFKKDLNGNFTIPLLKWNKLRSTKQVEDYDPNGKPPGPEFKPTMPAGTVKVGVSDVYDWYKLGQHVSNLKGLGKHDFGQGPPSTIMAFGSEPEEHKYIKDLEKTGLTTTDIDPLDRNQPKGMKRQKTDPTYNVDSYVEDLDEDFEWQDDPRCWQGDDKDTTPYRGLLNKRVKMSLPGYPTDHKYFIQVFYKNSPNTARCTYTRNSNDVGRMTRDIDFDEHARGQGPETFWWGDMPLTAEKAFNLHQCQRRGLKKDPKKQNITWTPLDEALDSQPYPYEEIPSEYKSQKQFMFKTDKDLTYVVSMFDQNKHLGVSFYLQLSKFQKSTEIENTGDARKVFATVIDIVKKYVNATKPVQINFTADEPSRMRLYDAFIKRLDRELPDYTGRQDGEGWYVLKRKTEDLDEALDSTPYPYEQIPPTHRDYTASRSQYVFTTNDNLPYLVTLFNYPGNRSRIEFKSKKQTRDFPDFGVTGSGDARKVFATVIEIVKKFVGEHHPVEISFSAKEPSRVRLYNAFMKRLDRELPDYEGKSGPGYEADNTYYYLKLKKPPLDETTDRDSAIQKIKKLQNTQGRSPGEIEAAKMLIAKLMKRHNINPKELRPVERNPYQDRINQARAERDVAGDMLKAEWDKFKHGIKDKVSSVFKEDEDWHTDPMKWHGGRDDPDWYDMYKTEPLKVKVRLWRGTGTYIVRNFEKISPTKAEITYKRDGILGSQRIDFDNISTYTDRQGYRNDEFSFYCGSMPITARQAFNLFQTKLHTPQTKAPKQKITWTPVDESLDSTPYPYEIEEDSITWQISKFTTSDRNRYKVYISKSRNKEVDIEFEWVGNDDKDVEAGLGIYNLGDSRKVFATIIKIVQDYVKKYKPNMLSFTAEEPSRKRLYSALVNRVDRALPDYEDQSADFLGDFHLVRKGYGVNESSGHLANDSKIVYHVTPTKNVKSIMRDGLRPQTGKRSSKISGEVNGIFVFNSKEDAEDAVMNWLGDEFGEDVNLSLLAIDSTGLENHMKSGAGYETIIDASVEPNRIRVAQELLEASGYIPSKKEANDPRFKTALTVDVKPDSIMKNAKAFGSKTSRAGIPPTARADGKI